VAGQSRSARERKECLVRAGGAGTRTQRERDGCWVGSHDSRDRHVTKSRPPRNVCGPRFGFRGCGGWGAGARDRSRYGCPAAAPWGPPQSRATREELIVRSSCWVWRAALDINPRLATGWSRLWWPPSAISTTQPKYSTT
jgi:hypothetical protein